MAYNTLRAARPTIYKLTPSILQKVNGVIFNLTGTLMDHGGQAPQSAIKSGFLAYGIHVPGQVIREYAGQTIHNQVNLICGREYILKQWDLINDRPFKQSDVNMISNRAYRELSESISKHAILIDGTSELTQKLSEHGIRIGITSEYGYHITHSVLDKLVSQGLVYDNLICIDQSEHPTETILAKWYQSSGNYNEYVKIGSTDIDIWEGLITGIHTCNMVDSSQLMGLTKQELSSTIRENYNFISSDIIKRWERINCKYYAKTIEELAELFDDKLHNE